MTGFQVCEAECDQCLFGPNRIVSPTRMREVLKTAQRKDSHFVCHKASIAGRDVACRGWHDRFSSNLSRIAERLGMVEFVDPATGKASAPLQAALPLPESVLSGRVVGTQG